MQNNQDCDIEKTDESKRDFITLTASAMAAVGVGGVVWPLVDSMNPSSDVLALGSIEVNVSSLAKGQSLKIMWRGKPVFIRHRTDKEVEDARSFDISKLPDPERDEDRVQAGKDAWLVMIGVCTHLGCIPIGERGDYGGWFCPCHGSHYDTSGRIRKGPAPKNLLVPEYSFLSDTKIKIG